MKFGHSLSVQITLVMALSLILAGVVNAGFVFSERARSGLIEITGPMITRFADLTASLEERPAARNLRLLRPDGPRFAGRLGRVRLLDEPRIDALDLPRNRRLEALLQRELAATGSDITDVRAASRIVGPGEREVRRDGAPERPRVAGLRRLRETSLAARLPDGRWLDAHMSVPLQPPPDGPRALIGILVLTTAVLGAALLVAHRVARPLQDLASAAEQVGATTAPEPVPVRGPGDVRQTIEAFNAMNRRVSDLLTEKDVMLGAIGHDLRTPLTSLRLRLESMEPEGEREKAIRTVEETSVLLESILDLARHGRSAEPTELVVLDDLVRSELDAYAERGAIIPLSTRDRVQIACQPMVFRRLLRNLLDNALNHGGGAQVSIRLEGKDALLEVADRGPGMSPETMESALRPFVRGEASRNRSSGGAGLGLALVDAIARAQGGSVSLANRNPTGLLVSVRLPATV